MIWSILLYVVLLVGCVCLAKCAENTDKKIYVWLIIACLTIIAGLRGTNVGIDTIKYTENFAHVTAGNMDAVYGAERSFLIIVWILQLFSKSPVYLFFIFSFVTNALILLRLWEFKSSISFPWAFLYFYACFYFFTFNIVRQMVAVAIIFWGTRYIQKKNYLKYILTLVVASLFHQSALLGVLYLIADLVWNYGRICKDKGSEYWKQHKKLCIVALCLGMLGAAFIVMKASKYIHYFSNITLNVGILVPMKLAFVIAFVLFVKSHTGQWGGDEENGMERFFNRNIAAAYGFGLFVTLLGYFYPFMDRIGLYFTIFGCPFIGYVQKKSKHPWLVFAIYGLIIILPFVKDLLSGGQGQLPYEFFWQGKLYT